jgi:hypothetical protein
MNHANTMRALKTAAIISAGFGLAMVFTLMIGFHAGMAFFIDLAHLPLDGGQDFASDSELLLGAISGGLLTGFGVMAWQVIDKVFDTDPKTGSTILTYGIVTWFVVDSTGSVLAGAWFNVILNAGFLALFMVPIMLRNPIDGPQAVEN